MDQEEREIIQDYVRASIEAYYASNPTGGSLHVVLDDGNLDKDMLVWCEQWAIEHADVCGKNLARLLLDVEISIVKEILIERGVIGSDFA